METKFDPKQGPRDVRWTRFVFIGSGVAFAVAYWIVDLLLCRGVPGAGSPVVGHSSGFGTSDLVRRTIVFVAFVLLGIALDCAFARYRQARRELERRKVVERAMAELSRSLIASADLDEISRLVCRLAQLLTESRFGFVGYIDPATGYLISPTVNHVILDRSPSAVGRVVFKSFDGLSGWSIRHKRPLLSNDVENDPRHDNPGPERRGRIRRLMTVPAMIDDRVVGQIAMANATRDYDEADLALLQRMAGMYALAAERERAAHDLARSESEKVSVLDSMTEVVIYKDLRNRVIWANKAAGEAFGCDRTRLVGRNINAVWRPCIERSESRAGDAFVQAGRACETEVQTDDGRIWAVRVRPVIDQKAHVVGSVDVAEDITERRRAEVARQRLASIVDGTSDAIYGMTPEGEITEWNRGAEAVFGYTADEVRGRTVGVLVPADDVNEMPMVIRQILKGRRSYQYESTRVRKDGARIQVQMAVSPMLDSRQRVRGVSVIARDITEARRREQELRRSRQELRDMSARLAAAEERERRRIATLLHDEIGQTLAVSQIKLAAFRDRIQVPASVEAIEEVRRMLDDAIQETRSLTCDLSPPVLYECGLEATIEWLAEKFRGDHAIRVEVSDDGAFKPIGDDVRTVLYQSLRELLHNVVKHASASSVLIRSGLADGRFVLTVQDDGIGFDPDDRTEAIDRTGGFGLVNVRERIGHFGGRMDIRSRPGDGTTITLRAPLASPAIEEQRTWG